MSRPKTETSNSASSREEAHTGSGKMLLDRLLESLTTEDRITLAPGVVIRDTYRLTRFLGRGGMGEVWQAVDLIREAGDVSEPDKYVAIKFLSGELRGHPDALKALVREFSRYRRLIHPNIVRAYELNRDGDQIYLVMEYLEGHSLKAWIASHPDGMDPEAVEPIIRGMCVGLSFAHTQGILHMDFKPGNVFYDPETRIAKVIDFGIARLSDPEEREKTRFDPGKLMALSESYSSPEMLSGMAPDRRDDIYGLGCVVYELLSGRHPFGRLNALAADHQGLSPPPIGGLSELQNKTLAQALSFQRESRLDEPEKLYEGLYQRALTGNQDSRDTQPGRWRMAFFLTAMGLLLAATIWGIGIWRHHRFEQRLIAGETEAISGFLGANQETQLALLHNPQVRAAVVSYWLQNAETDPDTVMKELPPAVRKRLFEDLAVRKMLIDHALAVAENHAGQGALAKAEHVLQQMAARYPDSGSLHDAITSLKKEISRRLETLEKAHQRCFTRNDLDCFSKVRAQLRQVAPHHPLFTDENLLAWLRQRIDTALNQWRLDEVETLLRQGRRWFPEKNAEWEALTQRFTERRQIHDWRQRLRGNERSRSMEVFVRLEAPLRDAILRDRSVARAVLEHYLEQTKTQADQERYPRAFSLLSDARRLLHEHREAQRMLDRLKRRLKRSRDRRSATLAAEIRRALKTGTNLKALQRLQRRLLEVDPRHRDAKLTDLPRYYTERIEAALAQEAFSEAEKLLEIWSILRPEDGHDKTTAYAKMQQRLQTESQRVALRERWIGRLRAVLAEEDLATLAKTIGEIPDELRQAVLTRIKADVLTVYRRRIEQNLAQKRFDRARHLKETVAAWYPGQKTATELDNLISRSIETHLNVMSQRFEAVLSSSPVDYTALFQLLGTMKRMNPDSPRITTHMTALGSHVQVLLSRGASALSDLQRLMAAWNTLATTDTSVAAALKKTKNVVALHWLLVGRRLMAAGKIGEAEAGFRFALSLKPVQTVRHRLEAELDKLKAGQP